MHNNLTSKMDCRTKQLRGRRQSQGDVQTTPSYVAHLMGSARHELFFSTEIIVDDLCLGLEEHLVGGYNDDVCHVVERDWLGQLEDFACADGYLTTPDVFELEEDSIFDRVEVFNKDGAPGSHEDLEDCVYTPDDVSVVYVHTGRQDSAADLSLVDEEENFSDDESSDDFEEGNTSQNVDSTEAVTAIAVPSSTLSSVHVTGTNISGREDVTTFATNISQHTSNKTTVTSTQGAEKTHEAETVPDVRKSVAGPSTPLSVTMSPEKSQNETELESHRAIDNLDMVVVVAKMEHVDLSNNTVATTDDDLTEIEEHRTCNDMGLHDIREEGEEVPQQLYQDLNLYDDGVDDRNEVLVEEKQGRSRQLFKLQQWSKHMVRYRNDIYARRRDACSSAIGSKPSRDDAFKLSSSSSSSPSSSPTEAEFQSDMLGSFVGDVGACLHEDECDSVDEDVGFEIEPVVQPNVTAQKEGTIVAGVTQMAEGTSDPTYGRPSIENEEATPPLEYSYEDIALYPKITKEDNTCKTSKKTGPRVPWKKRVKKVQNAWLSLRTQLVNMGSSRNEGIASGETNNCESISDLRGQEYIEGGHCQKNESSSIEVTVSTEVESRESDSLTGEVSTVDSDAVSPILEFEEQMEISEVSDIFTENYHAVLTMTSTIETPPTCDNSFHTVGEQNLSTDRGMADGASSIRQDDNSTSEGHNTDHDAKLDQTKRFNLVEEIVADHDRTNDESYSCGNLSSRSIGQVFENKFQGQATTAKAVTYWLAPNFSIDEDEEDETGFEVLGIIMV